MDSLFIIVLFYAYHGTYHITNEEVLRRLNKHRETVFTIKKLKMEYFRHAMRHEIYRIF